MTTQRHDRFDVIENLGANPLPLEPTEAAQPLMQTGAAHYQQGNLQEASDAFRSALDLQPDLTTAKFNVAVICRDLDQNEAAEAYFHEVVASGELVAEAVNNLGILAARRESNDESVAYFREAIRLRHQFPLAHFNLATMLLRLGQWEEGLREFEWRWQTPTFTPINCPQPQWDGQPLDGTLLLHTEQGIGDTFQFARFIPLIRERCRRVMFLRPESLDCMFPEQQWADEVRSPGEFALDSFDAVLPLMSAPLALKTPLNDLPSPEGYLTPVSRNVDLGPPPVANAKLKVGITWAGSPTYFNDAFRSTSVQYFAPLVEVDGAAFYSLQIGDRADELKQWSSHSDRVRDLREVQSDFADTAAIVRQLDLVIAVDTSLLHLAGGLGIPAWGLMSRRSDWRWMTHEYETSPWYRSVRLFRQRRVNDWDELMGRVAKELEALISSR